MLAIPGMIAQCRSLCAGGVVLVVHDGSIWSSDVEQVAASHGQCIAGRGDGWVCLRAEHLDSLLAGLVRNGHRVYVCEQAAA